MDTTLKDLQRKAILFVAGYALFYLLSLFLFPDSRIFLSDIFSVFGEIAAVLLIWKGIHRQERTHRVTWFIMFTGTVSYLIGDVIWTVAEVGFGREIPFPSVSDIFYIISSIVYVLGFFFYIRKENPFLFFRTGFDVLISMVLGATLIWKFEMMPIMADLDLSALEKIVSLSYPVFDLAFLGGVVSLFFFFTTKMRINPSNLLLSIAFLIVVIADQIYLSNVFVSYVSGGYVDVMWPVSFLLIALASLWPIYETELVPVPAERKKTKVIVLEYLRFLLPYLGVCVLLVIASLEYVVIDPVIVGIIISGLLVMIRQIFTLLENQRLLALIKETNRSLEASKLALEKQNLQLKKLGQLSEFEANTDFLTGLSNRRSIYRQLRNYAKQQGSYDLELAILLIDVDQFKRINDTFGHDQGDATLKQIAHLIRSNIRSTDIAGRFGGDEFIVILPNADCEFTKFLAQILLEKSQDLLLTTATEEHRVTISVGCAQWKGNARDFDINLIITSADKALYCAKTSGRNCMKLS